MPISSYVLRFRNDRRDQVLLALRACPGVEVGEPTDHGIPAVVDAPTIQAAETVGASLATIPGVEAATLVYHNFEDVTDFDANPVSRPTP